MRRVLAVAGLAVTLATGCPAPDPKAQDGSAIPSGCGLPTPRPRVDASRMPEAFLLDGEVEVVRVQKRKGGIIAAINIPYSVTEGFKLYTAAAEEAGFSLAGSDNEGFEAELYLRSKGELASVQVRRSICETASIVFVNIVDKDVLGG